MSFTPSPPQKKYYIPLLVYMMITPSCPYIEDMIEAYSIGWHGAKYPHIPPGSPCVKYTVIFLNCQMSMAHQGRLATSLWCPLWEVVQHPLY